jgi:hypothetical protein
MNRQLRRASRAPKKDCNLQVELKPVEMSALRSGFMERSFLFSKGQ